MPNDFAFNLGAALTPAVFISLAGWLFRQGQRAIGFNGTWKLPHLFVGSWLSITLLATFVLRYFIGFGYILAIFGALVGVIMVIAGLFRKPAEPTISTPQGEVDEC